MDKAKVIDNILFFYCEGCRCVHGVPLAGDDPWFFDNNIEAPTISPSLVTHRINSFGELVTSCHVSVVDGCARYYSDSEHNLSGQDIILKEVAKWPVCM